MRGTILHFNDGNGLVSGYDGNRYEFDLSGWLGKEAPKQNALVDFVVEDSKATNIFPLESESKYSKAVLAIVCWFFGLFGVHRFMVGKIGTGVVMLLITLTFVGAIVTSIWTIIDFIIILMGNFTDKDGEKIEKW